MSAKPPARKDPAQLEPPPEEVEGGRKDPEFKPLFDVSCIRLVNKDPSLEYVLVNLKIDRMASIYKMRGFKPVTQEPGGVESIMGPTVENGQVIEIMGMTLLARDLRYKQHEQMRAAQMCAQVQARIDGRGARPSIDDEVGPVVRGGRKILDVVNEGSSFQGYGGGGY